MTTIGRHIPIYDAWSNEGGGRAIEEGIRYSERKALEQLEAEVTYFNSAERRSAIERAEGKYAAARSAFIEKYGAAALDSRRDIAGTDRTGDTLDLSPEARAMLADLAALDGTRGLLDRGRQMGEDIRRVLKDGLETYREMVTARQNSYDARFEKDDNLRADAYERAEAARERLDSLAAQSAGWNAAAARRAGEVAAATASSQALFASTRLFEFQRDGTVRIDDKALANLGSAEVATAELARLIGVLTERNGLGQLRDALVRALNGQNRRIGELTGVL